MSDIDLLLRETLQNRADEAPGAGGLLARVQARSRRLRHRRRAGLAGAGVAAAVLVAAGTPAAVALFGGPPSHGAGVAGPPAPTGTARTAGTAGTASAAGTAGTAPARSAGALRAPDYASPTFPLVPTEGAVPGLAPPRALFDNGPYLYHAAGTSEGPSIRVRTASEPPPGGAPGGTGKPTKVRGHQGTLLIEPGGPHSLSLVWPESADEWITVTALNVTSDALLKYASGLHPGSVPVETPFTFEVLPQGLVLDQVGPSNMVFRTPDAPAGGSYEGKLAIMQNEDVSGDPATWPLRVNGRPASLIAQDGGRSLQASLGDGRFLVIQVPAQLLISDEDLMRIAAGTTVAPGATVAHG